LDDAFLRRLEGLRLRSRRLSGVAVGSRPGRQRTPAADFSDHRAYSPGDDIRHIDWNALARLDEVHVKVGQRPHATSVEILLDRSRSMAVPPGKWRQAVRLAAALGWLSLAAGDRLTLRGFPGDEVLWGRESGLGAAPGYLRQLAATRTVAGKTDLLPAIRRMGHESQAGGLAVLISDFWLLGEPEEALSLLPAPRWDVLALQVVSSEELDPPFHGALELEDPEGYEPIFVTVDEAVRAEVRREVRRRIDAVRRVFARRGADHALVMSTWPLEQAVLPFLRRSGVLVD
jgi:uncharacterized protein (DUF58 family)